MHIMAKKVTFCISIQKEYSLWHGLGSIHSKPPSCGESEFCHSRNGKLRFPRYLSRLMLQLMGKGGFLQGAAVAMCKNLWEM